MLDGCHESANCGIGLLGDPSSMLTWSVYEFSLGRVLDVHSTFRDALMLESYTDKLLSWLIASSLWCKII